MRRVSTATAPDTKPTRSTLVLITLVLGAIVANINTAISNVALPDIGRALDASNDQLTGITDAYQIAIAATVVYLGAVGDRYGRKKLLILGAILSVPFSIMSAFSQTPAMLIAAQMLVGVAGGMLYPTTLSLIRALWSGRSMTKAMALWAGVGAGASAFGPVLGGLLLAHFWWGSVFLITVPFAVAVVALAWWLVPRHAGETTDPVDHPGGVLSVIAISTFVLGIVWSPQGITPTVLALFGIALITGGLFAWRQLRIPNPIFDLHIAKVPTFWVAFVGGIAAFGALTGSLFIGQQFTQDVLGKSPLEAVLLVLPLGTLMVAMVPVTNHLMNTAGSKATLALGLAIASLGFVVIVFTWLPGASIGWVLFAYSLLGIGVGLASAPASRALTASVPVAKVGMGSAATDLTKDMGGAIFQALLGALLTFTYAEYFTKAYDNLPADQAQQISQRTVIELGSSYAGAQRVAENAPAGDTSKILAAANHAFTDGKTAAIMVALVSTVLGAVVVWLFYPSRAKEAEIFAKAQAGQHPGR